MVTERALDEDAELVCDALAPALCTVQSRKKANLAKLLAHLLGPTALLKRLSRSFVGDGGGSREMAEQKKSTGGRRRL
jgi:hypothetical protein